MIRIDLAGDGDGYFNLFKLTRRSNYPHVATKHHHYAAWISALASIIAILAFLTGKTRLSDYWASATALPHSAPAQPPQVNTAHVTLTELLTLRSSKNVTWLQKSAREAQLHGKRVTLSGYLVSAAYPIGKVSIEISPTKDGTDKFLCWAESSTKSTWSNISKDTFLELQTTLWKPMMGELVGEHTQLVKTADR